MIRKWIKKLLAPIIREVIDEEKEVIGNSTIGMIGNMLSECLDELPLKGVVSDVNQDLDSSS